MKKTILLIFMGLFVLSGVFADDIDLGDFPLGSWLDANYDAVWEFTTGNIRILSPSGELYFDFQARGIEDFKVGVGLEGPFITFTCAEVGKSYKLVKPLTSSSLILEITRTGLPLYRVDMPKQ